VHCNSAGETPGHARLRRARALSGRWPPKAAAQRALQDPDVIGDWRDSGIAQLRRGASRSASRAKAKGATGSPRVALIIGFGNVTRNRGLWNVGPSAEERTSVWRWTGALDGDRRRTDFPRESIPSATRSRSRCTPVANLL